MDTVSSTSNMTESEITPSPNGCDCIGNGSNPDIECQCDECSYFYDCFPYTNAPLHEYTIKDADDYIINEWVFKIDETKIEQIRNITNPFLKDHIKRCGVFVIAEDLGRENWETIYRISISIGDSSDRFHIGCIGTPKATAKADIIEWVCSKDAKRACELMIENKAILFSEPRKKR